jgi:hypothetical protein
MALVADPTVGATGYVNTVFTSVPTESPLAFCAYTIILYVVFPSKLVNVVDEYVLFCVIVFTGTSIVVVYAITL